MEIDHEGEGKRLRCITLSFALLIFFCILLGRGDEIPREEIKYGIKFASGLSLEVQFRMLLLLG